MEDYKKKRKERNYVSLIIKTLNTSGLIDGITFCFSSSCEILKFTKKKPQKL